LRTLPPSTELLSNIKSSAEAVLKNYSHLGWPAGAVDEEFMATHINQVPVAVVASSNKCKPGHEPDP